MRSAPPALSHPRQTCRHWAQIIQLSTHPYNWLGGNLSHHGVGLGGHCGRQNQFHGGVGSSARVVFDPPVTSLDFAIGDLDNGEKKDLRAYDTQGQLIALTPHMTSKTSNVSLRSQSGQSVRVFDEGASNGNTYDRYVRFHVDGPGISRLEADFVSRAEGSGNADFRVINACIGRRCR